MTSNSLSIDQIKSNYQKVVEQVEWAARSSGRNAGDIKVVVVTKKKSIITIHNAIRAGIKTFGENYADEAVPKINSINLSSEIHWHMIGHIQSRKARLVIEYFDYVHSLDSIKLAKRLNKFAEDLNKSMPTLVEFNISGEDAKYGFPAWREDSWSELLPSIEKILDHTHLIIRGLMTIPPYFSDPEQSRPYFQKLVRLQSFLQSNFPDNSWAELSMGMSADYQIAVEEGATWVRIGQAILGKRT